MRQCSSRCPTILPVPQRAMLQGANQQPQQLVLLMVRRRSLEEGGCV
jgi:hypothetical protein